MNNNYQVGERVRVTAKGLHNYNIFEICKIVEVFPENYLLENNTGIQYYLRAEGFERFFDEDDLKPERTGGLMTFPGVKPGAPPEPEAKPTALATQVGGDHYKDYPIQPLEFVYKNKIPAVEYAIIKYVVRHKNKNGLQDLLKAKHYLEYLIENEYPKA